MIRPVHQRIGAQPWSSSALLLCCIVACAETGTDHEVRELGRDTPLRDGDDLGADPSLSQAQFDAAALGSNELPSSPDRTGGAWRVVEVPGVQLARTPVGWLALSSRYAGGDAKNPSAPWSALYRSQDGVHWRSIPLQPQNDDLLLSRIVYGAGRYVLMGTRYRSDGGPVLWTSSDAEHWTERALPEPPSGPGWAELSYAQHRFFTIGFNALGVWDTGKNWKARPFNLIQGGAAAYGNGVYLLAGSGPMWTSSDGWEWQEHVLDCALPGACFGGTDHQAFHAAPIFAEGHFHSGELSSVDGEHWESTPGLAPVAYVSGHFLGAGGSAWVSGGEVQHLRLVRPARAVLTDLDRSSVGAQRWQEIPPPDTVDAEFEDGLNCETASCVQVGNSLLLVPPPGTPPLVDRLPRDADAVPLLSRDCPTSSMLSCRDYEARTGCVCRPDAPIGPEACADVSQYRCAGTFTPRPDEWQVDQLAQGDCTCDGVDPNQPAGFGTLCDPQASACPAPFECLLFEDVNYYLELRSLCSSRCQVDADCPSWQATGFCAGPVQLHCVDHLCAPRGCH